MTEVDFLPEGVTPITAEEALGTGNPVQSDQTVARETEPVAPTPEPAPQPEGEAESAPSTPPEVQPPADTPFWREYAETEEEAINRLKGFGEVSGRVSEYEAKIAEMEANKFQFHDDRLKSIHDYVAASEAEGDQVYDVIRQYMTLQAQDFDSMDESSVVRLYMKDRWKFDDSSVESAMNLQYLSTDEQREESPETAMLKDLELRKIAVDAKEYFNKKKAETAVPAASKDREARQQEAQAQAEVQRQSFMNTIESKAKGFKVEIPLGEGDNFVFELDDQKSAAMVAAITESGQYTGDPIDTMRMYAQLAYMPDMLKIAKASGASSANEQIHQELHGKPTEPTTAAPVQRGGNDEENMKIIHREIYGDGMTGF